MISGRLPSERPSDRGAVERQIAQRWNGSQLYQQFYGFKRSPG